MPRACLKIFCLDLQAILLELRGTIFLHRCNPLEKIFRSKSCKIAAKRGKKADLTTRNFKTGSRACLKIILLLSLCSCGFQVIYRERGSESEVFYVEELAAIRIKKDRTKLSQKLKNNLYDILNPDHVKAEAKYFLILSVKEAISSTFTTSSGASGRNKVILDVAYEFKNLATGATISTGTTSVNDSYDVTANRYGTYTADEYIRSNITVIVAQNIRNSLVNDLIEVRKKCDGKVEVKVDENFECPLSKNEKQVLKK